MVNQLNLGVKFYVLRPAEADSNTYNAFRVVIEEENVIRAAILKMAAILDFQISNDTDMGSKHIQFHDHTMFCTWLLYLISADICRF